MPRFHFHLPNGFGVTADKEGRELAGIDTARREAVRGARSIVSQEALGGVIDLRGRIEVVDERGEAVFELAFRDAVEVRTSDSA